MAQARHLELASPHAGAVGGRSNAGRRAAVARFLTTGEHDVFAEAWGGTVVSSARAGSQELRAALVAEVIKRTCGARAPAALADIDLPAWTRRKVEPMVKRT
jgi:hypothetical protein